jgi:hypothetical protein
MVLTFMSPVLHDEVPEPPSFGRGWHRRRRRIADFRRKSEALKGPNLTHKYKVHLLGVPQGSAQLLSEKGACVTGLTFVSPVLHDGVSELLFWGRRL